ncbi:phage antirepressor protein [Turicibacter sanguinis]|uniref:phage antirepressor n=1 Tax=Turicibacter sanguinis TaxID=154288 RepID=UPI0012BC8CA4|nr:phage antirepressor [Turicibacter sanguinis]MCU7195510.1 phage antirepressor [Turicibacter sanguinis]MTP79282.1 phage antirepressor protein [Turicibacter sanguinis]
MSNINITPFFKKEFGEIRVIEKNNEPWFVGKDVAKSLGYKNVNDALFKHVDEEDKEVVKCDTLGGQQNVTVINESGLYSLVLKSKLEGAKKFKRWVTSEVLPSIRKHGMYAKDELLDNPDLLIQVATKLKHEREKSKQLELEKAILLQQNNELKPKADYTDTVLKNKGLVTITAIAKDYGMSANVMNKKLHELGIQYKQGGQWFLYAKHQAKGYTSSETTEITRSNGMKDVVMNTKWTQKGRLFIYNELKKVGIVPLIEQDVAS